MSTTYKIHPAIGIARLGNSATEFCISPEEPASLPIYCDKDGQTHLEGGQERRVTDYQDGRGFKDEHGRIKRQAARFQIYVYDEDHPEGRPLKIGDAISGGGNQGKLVNIHWRVYLANKKACWYEFKQLEGEHGYAPDHPRRNAAIADPSARQRLIIDPGPRIVEADGDTDSREARFDRDGGDVYAPTFPPPLKPCSIDTLGELKTDPDGRLLVLGGHGNSGSFNYDEFGQPRIDTYANNDGWFDDTSDGPVTARLVMEMDPKEYGETVQHRFIDVEYPAWVIVGYPAYVPQILDMVTMDEVLYDTAVRKLAYRTDLYGTAGTFDDPERIDPRDTGALVHWRSGRLAWNQEHRPWFYRDIWPILFRPDEYTYLSGVLNQSNYPHNQSARGNFDPYKLGLPPWVDRDKLDTCEEECKEKIKSGDLFLESLKPVFKQLEKSLGEPSAAADGESLVEQLSGAVKEFTVKASGKSPEGALAASAEHRQAAAPEAKKDLERQIEEILARFQERIIDPDVWRLLAASIRENLRRYLSGQLLADCRASCREKATFDPFRDERMFLFDLLRRPGEENHFVVGSKATSRIHGLPLMPLLAGDNPLSNTLSSKFFRLTDFQYYLLRQWALGRFVNEENEGFVAEKPDPWQPYKGLFDKSRSGRNLDRGVLSNLMGGSFCPGAEVGWIVRNPSIYLEPYRIKADPAFYAFRQTAAQANYNKVPSVDYASYTGDDLSQDDHFDTGLQPGDVTKHMAVPWQSDFNECTSQPINITYEEWVDIYPKSTGDSLMRREERVWQTLWWPAHRPLQASEFVDFEDGKPVYRWLDWSRGVPGTNAGDLKMVTEWWRLGFIRQNPYLPPGNVKPTELPPDQKYISVERTKERKAGDECCPPERGRDDR